MKERIQPTEVSLPAAYKELLQNDAGARVLKVFVPDNDGQKELFLAGQIEEPSNVYSELANTDFGRIKSEISTSAETLLRHPDMNPKHQEAYEGFVRSQLKRTELMELAAAYNQEDDPDARANIRERHLELNEELYGLPDQGVYRSLLHDQVEKIEQKSLVGDAVRLREELLDIVGDRTASTEERFKPSAETMEWMHDAAMGLYGDLLQHIPEEQETFTKEEMQAIFQEIIDEEFGVDWTVDIEKATSISVRSAEYRIVIPENRADVTKEELQKLISHEIGIHLLRSSMGASTDVDPLKTGLEGYYDSEEGLGKVMEQALVGKLQEPGVAHYVTAGAVVHDKMNFRQVYELNYRLIALEKVKDGEEVTEAQLEKSKELAYKRCMRILRGTDELPWLKDLAYYNGTMDMWQHIEKEVKGDEFQLALLLLGKANPANPEHVRLLLESRTVDNY